MGLVEGGRATRKSGSTATHSRSLCGKHGEELFNKLNKEMGYDA